MTTFTMPKPIAWGWPNDEYPELIFDVICPDEHDRDEGSYTIPLYTAEALRDVMEQAAKWLDFYDGEGLRRAEAIRSMKEQIK